MARYHPRLPQEAQSLTEVRESRRRRWGVAQGVRRWNEPCAESPPEGLVGYQILGMSIELKVQGKTEKSKARW